MSQQIDLAESAYGSTRSAVVAFSTASFLDARQTLRDGNWRTHGDNPGAMYARSLKLIAVHKGDYNETTYICISSSHWDV